MAKKKEDALTLIQCSVGTKARVKKHAKAAGYFLNKMVDKIVKEYLDRKESEKIY